MVEHKTWVMPTWMEDFRSFLDRIGGGNPVEDLMNDHDSTTFNNAVRALLCCSMKSVVHMLETIHHDCTLFNGNACPICSYATDSIPDQEEWLFACPTCGWQMKTPTNSALEEMRAKGVIE